MGRKVFLDCGANKGGDIDNFRKEYGYDYEVIAFECEPRCYEYLDQYENITHIRKAIGTFDGVTSFYVGKHTPNGSLRRDKFTYMSGQVVQVEVIDFSKWLNDNFTSDDEVICLFNIEGAEYDILPKLFEDGTCDLIDKMYIEFHEQKLNDMTPQKSQELINKVIDTWRDDAFIYAYHQSEEFVKISAEFWKNNDE